MTDKQLIEQARMQLPDAKTFEGEYTEAAITLTDGMQHIVRFTKMISDGEITWMDLPLNS